MRLTSALVGPGSATSHTKPAGSLGDNVILVSLSFRERTQLSAQPGVTACMSTVPALACTLIGCLLPQRTRIADERGGRRVRRGRTVGTAQDSVRYMYVNRSRVPRTAHGRRVRQARNTAYRRARN